MFCAQRAYERALRHSYRVYVTDAIHFISQGKCHTTRWVEAIRPHEDIDVDATIERIAARLEG